MPSSKQQQLRFHGQVWLLHGHAVDAARGETARWSGQRWPLERNAAGPHEGHLQPLTDCGGAVTAPSLKAGNDCDAFFSTMDEDKEPKGIFS